MADNSHSDSASGGPIVISDEEEDTASVDTRHSQRRKTQKVSENGIGYPSEDDVVMGTGAASSSGALIPGPFAVGVSDQPPTYTGALVPGVAAHPLGVTPNGISDMMTTTNLVGNSVTRLPGVASTELYPQSISSPVTQLQVMSPNPIVDEEGCFKNNVLMVH